MRRRAFVVAILTAVLALSSGLGGSALATAQSNTATTPASSSKSARSASPKSEKLDIKSASKDELDALPGIGDALAQKIVAGRPYRTKRDLVTRKIIPQSTYEKIKDRIIAQHQKRNNRPHSCEHWRRGWFSAAVTYQVSEKVRLALKGHGFQPRRCRPRVLRHGRRLCSFKPSRISVFSPALGSRPLLRKSGWRII